MKIALALGGGGAKGYSHIGVIKSLVDAGINIDIVTGTSIGAFIGAIYAGNQLAELENFVTTITFGKLPKILSPAFSRLGLLSGDYTKKLLDEFLEEDNIEELAIPLGVVATDINNGETVTFTCGSIKDAIRASIAIPGLITPVLIGDRFLVDGGATEPVPVEAARELGADVVIAVDLISDFKPFSEDIGTRRLLQDMPFKSGIDNLGDYIKSVGESLYIYENKQKTLFANKTVFDIIQRISVITQARLIDKSFKLNPPDLIVRPQVHEIGILDFHKARKGIQIGEAAMKDKIVNLKKMVQ